MGMKTKMNSALVLLLLGLSIASTRTGNASSALAPAQEANCQTFPETNRATCGRFLQYWQMNGGLEQQGFPISGTLGEASPTDGKVYTVQYFERAVFEYHPENQPPNDVQLSLLGSFRYQQKYPTGAPGQLSDASGVLFKETGKRLGGFFLQYWQQHGGLAQQGYPISNVFGEKSDLDGKTYAVQYFERAVFEDHPELPEAKKVLLSQLGTFRYQQLSSANEWVTPPVTVPPAIITPSPTPTTLATPVQTEPTAPPTPVSSQPITIVGGGQHQQGSEPFTLPSGTYRVDWTIMNNNVEITPLMLDVYSVDYHHNVDLFILSDQDHTSNVGWFQPGYTTGTTYLKNVPTDVYYIVSAIFEGYKVDVQWSLTFTKQ